MKVGPLKSWRNSSPNRFSVTAATFQFSVACLHNFDANKMCPRHFRKGNLTCIVFWLKTVCVVIVFEEFATQNL